MDQDRKLVSHEQAYELRHIIDRYNVPKDVLEATMLSLGEDGKHERSREKIYAALEDLGYVVESK